MSTPMDHIAYLSQEIGPRPAGTEEEQQAALYITERFQNEAHLPVEIEDFTCSSDPLMPKLICYAVTLIATVLALLVPILAIPCVVVAVLSAGVFLAETFDKPVLSQLFMKGVSQNVVAKYEPPHREDGTGSRRRKVILVANYDSGKVRPDLSGFMVGLQKPLQYAAMASVCLLPLVIALRQFLFNGEGPVAIFFTVIVCLLGAVVLVPVVFSVMEKVGAYNEGANANAAGVAVMLEVARRISAGEAEAAATTEGSMHDEEAAYAAGVVPDGASISYDEDDAPMNEVVAMRKAAPGDPLAAAAAKAAELHEAAKAAEAAERAREAMEKLAEEYKAEQDRLREEERAKAEAEAAIAPAPSVPDWYLKATEKARKNYSAASADAPAYRSRYASFPEERQVVEVGEAHEEPMGEVKEIEGSVAPEPYVEEVIVAEDRPLESSAQTVEVLGEEPVATAFIEESVVELESESGEADEDVAADGASDESVQDGAEALEDSEEETASDEFAFEADQEAIGVMPIDAFLEEPAPVDQDDEASEEEAIASETADEDASASEDISVVSAAQTAELEAVKVEDEASEEAQAEDEQASEPVEDEAAAPLADEVDVDASEEQKPVERAVFDPVIIESGEAEASVDEVRDADPEDANGETTAMPALDMGELDLDALRQSAHPRTEPFDIEQTDALFEQHEPETDSESDSLEGTQRLPQAMFYAEPEDRSQELLDRSRKDRAVVTLTDDEVYDMSITVHEATPPASAAEVVSVAATAPASVEKPQPDISAEGTVAMAPIADADAEPRVEGAVPNLPVIPSIEQAAGEKIPVVELPKISLPSLDAVSPAPISYDELRQRAPLASVAESNGQQAAKSLLATTLPSISGVHAPVQAGTADQPQNNSVSVTGSFAAISAVGAEPVGDELIENVAPEDVYVDDADDSSYEDEFTETGAFAGPGYVEMPQSRVGKFFGKFRRKKKHEEESAHEWLGVDEDFDARKAGKERGSWESFRNEDDDWQGGAFGGLRGHKDEEELEQQPERPHYQAPIPVSRDAFAAALAAANAAAEASGDPVVPEDYHEEIEQIYSFAAGDINTEVWFVALGSDLAGNGGIKAFLAEHASEMRGAIIVNLEALGAGSLSYLEKEGAIKQATCSPRMKRFIRKASQASGIEIQPESVDWKESPASYAQKHRMQAMTLAGMDGKKPAFYGEADDIAENIDPKALDRSADVVIELLKNI